MKKVYSLITGFLLSFALTSPAWANVITVQAFSADSSVTHMENFRSVVVTAINGNIAGGSGGTSSVNILADSVGEIEMANDANPRVRDSELLSITTDSTTASNTFVYTGGVPATAASLTSNISACTAYINGYRVATSATSRTYTASRDTYVDLSQTGSFTFSEVTVGAAAPAVAANSARLSRVTTDGTTITTVTDLANRRIPGLLVPAQYRNNMRVSRDSTTTLTVQPGSCEINNTIISKTALTTLTLTTAGDWAGGTSLRAASTMGFVGIDASGNLKMHTTAPTHDNYGVSTTVGKRRYATWSSTVYRILGWFYMNGAQQLYASEVGNIKEGDVGNAVITSDENVVNFTSTSFIDYALVNYYSSGGDELLIMNVSGDPAAGIAQFETVFSDNGTQITNSGQGNALDNNPNSYSTTSQFLQTNLSQGTHVYRARLKMSGSNFNARNRKLIVIEE